MISDHTNVFIFVSLAWIMKTQSNTFPCFIFNENIPSFNYSNTVIDHYLNVHNRLVCVLVLPRLFDQWSFGHFRILTDKKHIMLGYRIVSAFIVCYFVMLINIYIYVCVCFRVTTLCLWQSCFGGLKWSNPLSFSPAHLSLKVSLEHRFRIFFCRPL